MPRPLIIIGPVPEEGLYFCAVCVARYKTALVTALGIDAEWIKRELTGRETDPPKVIAAPRDATMPPVEYAVTHMPVSAVDGSAAVCWTHADALGTLPVQAAPGTPANGANKLIPGMSL